MKTHGAEDYNGLEIGACDIRRHLRWSKTPDITADDPAGLPVANDRAQDRPEWRTIRNRKDNAFASPESVLRMWIYPPETRLRHKKAFSSHPPLPIDKP